MLNKDGIRELCYLTKIDNIKPIEGRDRVEIYNIRIGQNKLMTFL